MEKLTIKPWQVMQAHENGANIEYGNNRSDWDDCPNPIWDFNSWNYRIANLTADGMRLDELVEKFPDVIKLCPFGCFLNENYNTKEVLSLVINQPKLISQIKLRQEKKLRPWTIKEFEKHRDEWFKLKNIDDPVVYKITAYSKSVVTVSNYSVTYAKLSRDYTFTDGSPCGVFE